MLDTSPIIEIKGIGEKTEKLFHKLNIFTVGDLLSYYPRDYETFKEPVPIMQAPVGELCAVRACVTAVPNVKKIRNLTVINALIRDASGTMSLTFFNMPFLKNMLRPGGFYIFRGLVQSRGISRIMEQPKLYSELDYHKLMDSIQPKYSLTKGLTNQAIQKAAKKALSQTSFKEELYPASFLRDYSLISYKEAIHTIHFPKNYDDLVKARRRLVFDEFFTFLFLMQKNKDASSGLSNEYPIEASAETERFLNALPFQLTNAQKKVWEEIKADLIGPYAMNRLIQGDVGSGKTILAVLSLLACACAGYQGAMMAPTEVLAMQHYETVCEYIEAYHLPLRPVLLVGSMPAKKKREAYESLASAEANLAIGTHAVIQEKVSFQRLALVITDEQHRFGVRQREALAEKGLHTHVLVMSATPIPRTLAIILYGDLHISIVNELPANRLPIKNCVVNTSYRPKAYAFIAKQVAQGRQAYVICPMVEESEGEQDNMENVTDYAGKLSAALPSSVRIGILHGKMKPADKNRIMEDFSAGNLDVLVSTTVIEVGINVPNATVMMVENAERFGLAQLHQLRGRVGRGAFQSYCIFINSMEKKETMERLEILNRSNDGFYIASEDLKLRGPGDLFGIRQSGEFSFRIGDIYTDSGLLKLASCAVDEILRKDPDLSSPEHAPFLAFLTDAQKGGVDFRSI
mgnify:CR=1 FL=1